MHIIDISGAVATIRKHEVLTKGRVGAQVLFLFDEDWTGLTKMAVFRQGAVTKDCVINANKATVPWECLESVGIPVEIGVYGISSGGDIIIPTIWATTREVREGADPSGDESLNPTLEVWEQILALMGDLNELNTENKDTLVAAINEVLITALTTIGDLEELDTEAKDSLVAAVNELAGSILLLNEAITEAKDSIGDPEELETTAKVSIVAAVNEVVRSVSRLNDNMATMSGTIGDLNELDTTVKTSLVNAINEVLEKKQNPLPAGGKTGQILTLDADGNPVWTDAPEGGSIIPDNGSVGQVLTKTSAGYGWEDLPEDEIPADGTAGQVLTADADGNPVWANLPEAELPTGGSNGQVLTLVSGSPAWADVPETEDEIPTDGTAGQVLTKTAGGFAWGDLPEQEAELPAEGADGQVLTLTDGSPAWADLPEAGEEDFYIRHTSPEWFQAWPGQDAVKCTIDRTASEILEAIQNGDHIWFVYNDMDGIWNVPMTRRIAANDTWYYLNFFSMIHPGFAIEVEMENSNGTVTTTAQNYYLDELPSGGTEGQILTKTATGVAWGDAPSGTFIVAGTLDEDGTVTLDKTYAEMKEAYAAGKELLVRLTNTDYTAELPLYGYWLGGFVFHKITGTGPLTAELLTVSSEDVVYLNQTLELDELPSDGVAGQYLSLDAGGIPVWADFPEQETELPTGGTAGQVLTIGSDGSPVWADPATLTSVYEGVF